MSIFHASRSDLPEGAQARAAFLRRGRRKGAVFPFNLSSHFTLEMISIKNWEIPLSWDAKCSLPFAVRVSKTRVVELPIIYRRGSLSILDCSLILIFFRDDDIGMVCPRILANRSLLR